jgi:tetratricopeptide (TPR) repeat protein
VIHLLLFAALALPPQQAGKTPEADAPVAPEQVLAWQLEGLTQEEIRDEVGDRGLTERPEEALLSAVSAAGADAETIRALRETKAPRNLWKLGLRLPKPTDYLYEIAGALLWRDEAAALQAIQSEAEKQPRNPDVHLVYAHLARREEDWITAYGEATKAVALAPEWPYAHALRSTICYHSQLVECAVREAMQFVKMRPEDAAAYIVLGHARGMQGMYEEALEAYTWAEKFHPGYNAIYAGRGAVYEREGELENAAKSYEQAIRLDGKNFEYYRELAQVYWREGDAKRAIEMLQHAKELAPERLEILLALGDAYLRIEKYDLAIGEYREVLEMAPDAEPVKVRLAKALRAEGRMAEASQVLPETSDQPGVTKPQ